MKKFLSIFLILVMVVCLAACGDDAATTTTSTEVVGTQVEIGNGMDITMDEDSVRAILGSFTSEQLRITGDIYDYTLVLSAEVYNDVNGCRVEAIPAGGTAAEQVYFVDGIGCYVYDNELQKYVSVVASAGEDSTDTSDTTTATGGNPPQSDVPVDFQYHEANNTALHERFSQYDLSPVGMEKELSEYILVVSTRVAVVSGANVNVIEVYEADGTLTDYRLALGVEADYYYDSATQTYIALS